MNIFTDLNLLPATSIKMYINRWLLDWFENNVLCTQRGMTFVDNRELPLKIFFLKTDEINN